ncbi:hypothetical protein ZIOFF_022044 [Zingiber officinale]|uniref:Uncharacterized protein n=1 Tax=Zingiber officinale TaxID=94328 RepID=A0A8J5H7V9_ZINOF|nr:hypothetical protein ZIOFF_022044 [Zingiber officinale]
MIARTRLCLPGSLGLVELDLDLHLDLEREAECMVERGRTDSIDDGIRKDIGRVGMMSDGNSNSEGICSNEVGHSCRPRWTHIDKACMNNTWRSSQSSYNRFCTDDIYLHPSVESGELEIIKLISQSIPWALRTQACIGEAWNEWLMDQLHNIIVAPSVETIPDWEAYICYVEKRAWQENSPIEKANIRLSNSTFIPNDIY